MTQFWNVTRNVCISITFTCIFFENIAYVAKVEGVSMQPTLNDDPEPLITRSRGGLRFYLNRINSSDIVLLSHWSTRNYNIQRGDIVSLISPKNPNQLIIKRVIGLEGDRVTARASARFANVKIPKGQCWVEGDNSAKSMDSNAFGPVAKGLITAQAKCIIWPPKRWRIFSPEFPADRLVSPVYSSIYESSHSIGFKSLKPLNIGISDHHSRIDDARYFIEATRID